MNTVNEREREEIELLLPWFVNGTLEPGDAARVEAAVAADPHLALSLSLLGEEADAVHMLAEADMPPQSMEARFLAQLDAEGRVTARAARVAAPGIAERLGAWLSAAIGGMTPPRLAYAAAAACLLVVVQSGALVAFLAQPQAPRLASGGEESGAGPTLIVQLNEAAPVGGVATFLVEIGARIVDGPSGGLFTLRFASEEAREIGELAQILRDKPEYFKLVLPGK